VEAEKEMKGFESLVEKSVPLIVRSTEACLFTAHGGGPNETTNIFIMISASILPKI